MVFGRKKNFQYKFKIVDTYVFSKDKVVLIGMTIEAHIESFVKNVKLYTVQRIRKFLIIMQTKVLT